MNITYNCNCDGWMRFLVQTVLEEANIEQRDFEVFAADDRRIWMHTKVWNENAAPAYIGMAKGNWEERTWVLKYECESSDRYNTDLEYVLFDTDPSKTYNHKLTQTMTLYHMVPTEIARGFYRISQRGNAVKFSRLIYR